MPIKLCFESDSKQNLAQSRLHRMSLVSSSINLFIYFTKCQYIEIGYFLFNNAKFDTSVKTKKYLINKHLLFQVGIGISLLLNKVD